MAELEGILVQLTERLVACFNQGDADGFQAQFTEDCMLMVPGQDPIHGREGTWTYFRDQVGKQATLSHVVTKSVKAYEDNVAISWGTCLLEQGANKDAQKWVHVNRKVDGKWMICLDMWNSHA